MKIFKLIPLLLMLVIAAPAWSQAVTNSVEYTTNIRKGDQAYNQGRYNEAIRYYTAALNAQNGNSTVARNKINQCRVKLSRIAAQNARAEANAARERMEELDEAVVWEAKEKYNGNRNLNEPVNQNRIRKELE